MANKCACGWGSALDPAGAAYSAPADLIAGLRCLTSKGKGSAPSDPLIGLRGPTSKGRVRREKGGGGKRPCYTCVWSLRSINIRL